MVPPATTLVPAASKAQLLRSFDPADFPELTGREEEWRFTPLDRLAVLLGPEPGHPVGRPRVESQPLPPGVSETAASGEDPRIGSVLIPFDKLSALAYRRCAQAAVFRVEPGARPQKPVMVTVAGGEGSGAADRPAYGHLFIEVGSLAEATMVVEWIGDGHLADNVEVAVADGAQLTLVTVENAERTAVHAQHLRFRLGRDARVRHIQVTLGGGLVRQYTSIDYAAPGAECEAYGIYFADGGQHLEHRLLVDHAVADCRSFVSYRGALSGEGTHTVWVGDVIIRAAATGTDTYEINRNLVLGDGARADSVPNLEIETGEVVGAGHASTTGRFDEEQLFYLMARGIPETEARTLVVTGFFAELLANIPVEVLRDRLGASIEARLARGGNMRGGRG
ncbi:MAG: Fe-S cluster assembly protein SufD [Micromonosporaceae bacterium]|nr:Fe-S cluster assembly protein SufD [Micromonosporaceae bacterium]